jgi:hypothetical protein
MGGTGTGNWGEAQSEIRRPQTESRTKKKTSKRRKGENHRLKQPDQNLRHVIELQAKPVPFVECQRTAGRYVRNNLVEYLP